MMDGDCLHLAAWQAALVADLEKSLDPAYLGRWRLFRVTPKADSALSRLSKVEPELVRDVRSAASDVADLIDAGDDLRLADYVSRLRRRIGNLIAARAEPLLVTLRDCLRHDGGRGREPKTLQNIAPLPDVVGTKDGEDAYLYSDMAAWYASHRAKNPLPAEEEMRDLLAVQLG